MPTFLSRLSDLVLALTMASMDARYTPSQQSRFFEVARRRLAGTLAQMEKERARIAAPADFFSDLQALLDALNAVVFPGA